MSTSHDDVSALMQGTSRRRMTWDKPEPCYCKISPSTGLLALSLTSFTTLHEKLELKEQISKLHKLHLQLDRVVMKNKAVKFSGSSESYLVAACCSTPMEAAQTIRRLAEDLIAVNKDVKCVVSLGEVGFAILGSTAWNYQFYGELVTELKTRAEALGPGELIVMPSVADVLRRGQLSKEEIEASVVLKELTKYPVDDGQATESDESEQEFRAWWALRVQYTDIWVLVLTFILAAVSIKNQLNQEERKISMPIFLQVQCCIVNGFAVLGWIINRDWFVRRHTTIMSVVWCTQFFSRAVQTWTRFPSPDALRSLPMFRQLLAMNGPEKLLLMTAPVNITVSGCLHWLGFVGSLGVVYRSCFGTEGVFDPSRLPSTVPTMLLISFFAFFAIPMWYSIRVESEARKAFEHHRCARPKSKEN